MLLLVPIAYPNWQFQPLMELLGMRFQSGASQWHHVAIASVSDVEQLCTSLSRKIWQKIMILPDP